MLEFGDSEYGGLLGMLRGCAECNLSMIVGRVGHREGILWVILNMVIWDKVYPIGLKLGWEYQGCARVLWAKFEVDWW